MYLAPRLVALDRVMTVDESFWLGRSANFYQALATADFADTYQFAHPGVMTMWAGTLGFLVVYPTWPNEIPGQIRKEYAVHEDLRALGRDPLPLLIAGRVAKLLMQAAFLAVGFWLARATFGTLTAVAGALLLAFDPFLIAHDRLLHIDGMFALSAFVSLLGVLRYLHGPRHPHYLVISGIFAAFGWLTRTPGVVVVGVVGLIFLVVAWRQWRSGEPLTRAGRSAAGQFGIWLGAALATTFLAWPALWVAPGMVMRRMLSWSLGAAAEGHEAAIFFNGQSYQGDPGLLYYPVSILWRLTPFTMVGLAALVLILALAVGRRAVFPRHLLPPLAVLGFFVLLYVGGMSLGAKKFDRYVLPAYPALDLLAAIGFVGAGRLLWSQRTRWTRPLAVIAITAVVFGQLLSALSTAPYYLPYFNPLLGGTAGAEGALLLGWGEGLDQTAAFIRSRPGGDVAIVHMSNARVSLTYFMPESATVVTSAYQTDMASMLEWVQADYYVAYVSQWQRGSFSRPLDYLSQFQPVHTVRLGGTTFARTYDLNAIPPPPEMVNGHPCSFTFGDDVQLVAYQDQPTIDAGDANPHTFSFHFVSSASVRAAYEVRVDFLPRSPAIEPFSRSVTLRPDATPGMLSQIELPVELPGKRTIKSYIPLVSVIDPVSGQPITATQVVSGVTGNHAVLTRCA